ncbi:PTS mannose/fructose/sorbose/N-acetylgalactosamine transporter subunit IIC [Brachyspira aalborgi]|uniref:PTS mannose/fructose/sorbose/N-acetylgalactosamine transporter subunit IIC n=1 Tax=Brachyspira aalborgi TaxID=29522 RepID=UPI001F558564|nr:PTS sugar transporter subunit IIC [Brachyspira aalborgi]
MGQLSSFIILILCLYTIIGVLDQISIQIGIYSPLFAATFTGLLLGDIKSGLLIGATLQLATLGVATYGGATVPDYLSGAIIGTAYTILSGKGAEYGIAIAVPIGLLLTQLDILGRMSNLVFQHKADKYAEKGDYKGVEMCNVLGIIPWTLSRLIPVSIGLIFGDTVISHYKCIYTKLVYERAESFWLASSCNGYRYPYEIFTIKKIFSIFYYRICCYSL